MCLEKQDKRIKKHSVGYKLCRRDKDGFRGEVFNTGPYYIGQTYDAKTENDPIPEVGSPGGVRYKAGFHYFLKMKDAKALCCANSVVIRIEVKNVLATGIQNDYAAGVAEYMTLNRVVADGVKIQIQREKDKKKKFLSICRGKAESKLLEFAKQFKLKYSLVKIKDMRKILDFMTKSTDTFAHVVRFLDIMPRDSKFFKLFTRIHMWAFDNHDGYKSYYYLTLKDENAQKKLRRDKDYNFMINQAQNIDEIVLNKI